LKIATEYYTTLEKIVTVGKGVELEVRKFSYLGDMLEPMLVWTLQ
jgi:hypothetical protein